MARIPMYVGSGPSGTPTHPAWLVRAVLSTHAHGGVSAPNKLKPREQATIDNTVRLAPGGVVVKGEVNNWQGNYIYEPQSDWTSPAFGGNSTSADRFDMLVVRVEDPNFEGSRDLDADDIIFQEIIPDVGSSATTLADAGKPGYSAEPMARVRIPANTSTPNITDGDITDLRKLADPKLSYFPRAVNHSDTIIDHTTRDTWLDFENSEVLVDVPSWATHITMDARFQSAAMNSGGTSGGNMFGEMRLLLDNSLATTTTFINFDWDTTWIDTVIGHIDKFEISTFQGQQLSLRLQIKVNFMNASTAYVREHRGTTAMFGIGFSQDPI